MNLTAYGKPPTGARPSPPARRSFLAEFSYLLPACLLLYAILLPQEFRISAGGVNLYAYRIVCLALLPWLIKQALLRQLRAHPVDALVAFGAFWMILSFVMNEGLVSGLVSGGGLAVDVIMPYFITRASIRSLTDLRRVLVLFSVGIFASGVMVMVESLTRQEIIKPAFEAVFGAREAFITNNTGISMVRFGLLRGSGPFAHPILAGLILASAATLYLFSGIRHWPKVLGLFTFGFALFSISFSAILSIAMSLGLTVFDRISRHFTLINWPLFLTGASISALFVHLMSENGLPRFLARLTLDPATSFFRILTWRYGTESVARNPWFGIAFDEYERLPWMNNSIDAYWLSDAIRHGLVVPVSLLLATIWAISAVGLASLRVRRESDRRLLVGLAIVVGVLALMGFTVTFFGGVLLWYYFLLGSAISLAANIKWPGNRASTPANAGALVA